MGAVTTASNSTSWTNSSSPRKKGEQESREKSIFLPRCLRESFVKEHLPGQNSRATWHKKMLPVKGWEHDLLPWVEENTRTDVTAKIINCKLSGRVWVLKCGQVRGFQMKLFIRPSLWPFPWLNRLTTVIASDPCFDLSSGCRVQRTPATLFHSRIFLQDH